MTQTDPTAAHYRQRPNECDAIQWTGDNADQLRAFAGTDFDTIDPEDRIDDPDQDAQLLVEASHWVGIKAGDWVLKFEGYFVAKADEPFRAVWEPAVSAVVAPPTDRAAIAERLWQVAEQTIIAEWICCDPINPKHQLCVQGDATLRMVRALLVDDPDAAKPAAPLLDAVLAVLGEPTDRPAVLREAADMVDKTIAPADWDAPSISAWNTGTNIAAHNLRRLAVEAHGTGTQQQVPQRAYPDCERCGDTGVDPEWDGAEPCPECQQTNVPAPVETDEERADREATERDHARGDHTYCGITCETEMPTEHLRNFVIAKGYPGTRGALDELLRRARTEVAEQQPAAEASVESWARALAGARVMGRGGLPFDQLSAAEQEEFREHARQITEQQAAASDGEETPVHAIPGLDDNGISPCCGRRPFDFRGEHLTRDPDKVTCRGPRP